MILGPSLSCACFIRYYINILYVSSSVIAALTTLVPADAAGVAQQQEQQQASTTYMHAKAHMCGRQILDAGSAIAPKSKQQTAGEQAVQATRQVVTSAADPSTAADCSPSARMCILSCRQSAVFLCNYVVRPTLSPQQLSHGSANEAVLCSTLNMHHVTCMLLRMHGLRIAFVHILTLRKGCHGYIP